MTDNQVLAVLIGVVGFVAITLILHVSAYNKTDQLAKVPDPLVLACARRPDAGNQACILLKERAK